MSDESALMIDDDGPIRHLRFNRPDKLNALDLDQHDRIMSALIDADADPTVRVVALSGEGRAYCAGDDLGGRPDTKPAFLDGRRVDLDVGIGPALLLESCAVLRRLSKPTVVLMHGHALGSGYDYSLSCDFRLATHGVNYGDPRMNLALWAAEGWSWKLPRQVHQSAVTPIAYLGQTMSGQEAFDVGLVHRIYEDGVDLRESAADFLTALSRLDGAAYRRTKQMMLEAQDASFEQSLRLAQSA
jgi:enoyl-CoA hydratase